MTFKTLLMVLFVFGNLSMLACAPQKGGKTDWSTPWSAPEESNANTDEIIGSDGELQEDQSSLVGGIVSAKSWVGYWQSKSDKRILRLSDKYLDKYRDLALQLYIPHFMWSPTTGDRQQTPTKGIELKAGTSRKQLTAQFLIQQDGTPSERVNILIEAKSDAEIELVWIKESLSGKLVAKITQIFTKLNYDIGENLYRQDLARYSIEFLRHQSYQKTVYDDNFCRKETELVTAAAMGEINCVKYILDNFAKLNPQLKTQALFKAIENGDLEMISVIFRYKVRFTKEQNFALALETAMRPAFFYLHMGDLNDLEEGIPRYLNAGAIGEYLIKINPQMIEKGSAANYFFSQALRTGNLSFVTSLIRAAVEGKLPEVNMELCLSNLALDHNYRFGDKAPGLMREALKVVRKDEKLSRLSGDVLGVIAKEANVDILKVLKDEFKVSFNVKNSSAMTPSELLTKELKQLKDLSKKPENSGVNSQYLLQRRIKILEQNLAHLNRR